jgi:hypothetical protein
MVVAGERDADSRALDDVPAIRDDGFQHALSHSEPTELEPVDDPAGNPDEDDDADLQPDGYAGRGRCARREEDDRRVVAG